MRYISKSENETHEIAFTLGRHLVSGDCVLLYGELGAGKSVFARGCARALGVKDVMASPSFTLMQPYSGDIFPVRHFDLYRLSGEDELYYSGLEEQIGAEGVSLIEWPQQADVCPPVRVEVDIEKGENDVRIIDIVPVNMENREQEIFAALRPFEAETQN